MTINERKARKNMTLKNKAARRRGDKEYEVGGLSLLPAYKMGSHDLRHVTPAFSYEMAMAKRRGDGCAIRKVVVTKKNVTK
jgi:hypothetical protein